MGFSQHLVASEVCDRHHRSLRRLHHSPIGLKAVLDLPDFWEDRFPTADADIRELLPCVSFDSSLSRFLCGFGHDDVLWRTTGGVCCRYGRY